MRKTNKTDAGGNQKGDKKGDTPEDKKKIHYSRPNLRRTPGLAGGPVAAQKAKGRTEAIRSRIQMREN